MSARQDQARQQRIEEIARAAYDRCHPEDSFDDMKHRASFSKEDRMLLRDWLAAANAQLSNGKSR
ncbi:MAG: hypothetical protein WBA88_18695 [Pseudaminobacter sp.]